MPTTPGKNTIAQIAKLMKEDASLNLEIVGHCDDDEFNEGKINVRYKGVGKKRAGQVKRLLEAEGISPTASRSLAGRTAIRPAHAIPRSHGPRTAA